MRVTFTSANLGYFERHVTHAVQSIPPAWVYESHLFTDVDYPVRTQVMQPRLQAKVPKMLSWQLKPGADIYLWLDASFQMMQPDALSWLVGQLDDRDLAVYRHPVRATVAQEAEYLRSQFVHSRRLQRRYAGEWLDELMAHLRDVGHQDTALYAAGILAYRNTARVQEMLQHWFYLVARYHINDQLSLPYVIQRADARVAVIDGDIYHDPRFLYARHRHV